MPSDARLAFARSPAAVKLEALVETAVVAAVVAVAVA